MRYQRVAWICVLLVAGTAVAKDEPARAKAPSAAQGYEYMLERAYLPVQIDTKTFDLLWTSWPDDLRAKAEAATPAERRRMAFERYGLTTRPGDDSGKPLQYVVDENGHWSPNCMLCHTGQIDGQIIPGLPNAHLALQTLAEDALATKKAKKLPFTQWDFNTGLKLLPLGDTTGTTNAVAFSVVLLRMRDTQLNVVKAPNWKGLPHHDLDAPPWWHYRKRPHIYIDGFGKKNHRTLMQFMLVPSNDRPAVLKAEPDFRHVEAYLNTLEAPTWPHAVDEALALKGKPLFEKNCAGCHGTYGATSTYPDKIIPIDVIGTDRVRLDAITVEERTIYSTSWLTDGDATGIRTNPGGYVAPPLDGVWASAPYFHNGSVPTLWHVMNPDKRPARWKRAYKGYDTKRVGLVFEEPGEGLALPTEPSARRQWYDTSKHGKSAAGHDFPAQLSAGQRRAVLEYLKTL